jgi:hypothetical protein
LWSRPTSTGRGTTVVLLALAALELAPCPPWPSRDVLPTRAHRWLAGRRGVLRALDCVPATRTSDAIADSLVGHPVSLLGPEGFEDCGEPGLGARLAAGEYTHVVVRRDTAVAAWLAARPAPPGLALGPEFEDSRILEVTALPPALYLTTWLGFYPREYDQASTWRWMAQTGALRIAARRPVDDAVLELELKAFPGPRRVEWLVEGRHRGTLPVVSEWRRYELPLGSMAPGDTILTLACTEAAVPARDVLVNGDPRPLALALGGARLRSNP